MTGPDTIDPRRHRRWGLVVLCGGLSALIAGFTLYPAATTGDLFNDLCATPFFMLALVPLLIAMFAAGMTGCLVASLIAAGGTLFVLHASTVGFFALADIVPALGASFFAWRASPDMPRANAEGNWLAFLALYAALVYLAFHALLDAAPGGLTGAIAQAMNANADQAFASFRGIEHQDPPAEMVDALHRAIPQIAPVVPAMLTASWMLLNVFALAVAQRLAPRAAHKPFVFRAVRVPGWVVFLTAGAGLIGAAAPQPYGTIGVNLAVMTGLPYLFAGLAVIHARAARMALPRMMLAAVYILLSLMPYLALVVALIGLLDEWFDFRAPRRDPDATR